MFVACGDDDGTVGPPADNSPPALLVTHPYDNETGVAVDDSIYVILSEEVDCSSVTDTTFYIKGGVPADIHCHADTIVLIPVDDLRFDTMYEVHLAGSVADMSGNRINVNSVWIFTTESEPPGLSWRFVDVPVSSTESLNDVTYSGEAYVAVGNNGVVVRSIDGESWEKVESPAELRLYSVHWFDSMFIAVGEGEFIMTSPDGLDWTVRRQGHPARTICDVVSTGERYLAVGGHFNQLAQLLPDARTSDDAVEWQHVDLDFDGWLGDVIWTGLRFVAVGGEDYDRFTIWTSEDGQQWSKVYATSGFHFYESICQSDKLIVACGGIGQKVLISTDGIYWMPQPQSHLSGVWDVEWTGELFVAVGNSGGIITSPDGLNWTRRQSGVSQSLNGVWGSRERIIAVGGNKAVVSP